MPYSDIFRITKDDQNELTEVWEASVRATHDFLDEEYLQFIKTNLPSYFEAVTLYGIRNAEGKMIAFTGISNQMIEMLFIHPATRGKGFGKKLIHFAYAHHQIRFVDVNEQNKQAVQFYLKMGFSVIGRDELDSAGKPYPILHMQLDDKPKDFPLS